MHPPRPQGTKSATAELLAADSPMVAQVAGSLGKLEQAVDFAQKLVAIEPDQAPVLESSQQNVQRFAAACEALENNDFGGCMEALAEIEDSGVSFRDLIHKQAECCLGLGNGSQTQRLTLKLIRENADDVDAYTLRGMALYLCDNVDQASDLNAALKY